MNIPRYIQDLIESQLGKQKVIMLYGSRRTGKTTIIEHIQQKYDKKVLMLLGEDMIVAESLQLRTVANYKQIVGDHSIIIIDEAQAIPEIGKVLKLMIDNVKGITIVATGSSSFDLVYDAGEPLVGRSMEYQLYPVAQTELSKFESKLKSLGNLEERMIYGNYPELWQLDTSDEKELYLKSLINGYLLKDLLAYSNVKGADVLYKLLKLLAFQVGSQVSTVELGSALQLNKETVERYLDLLSKVFIIYPLHGFSKNLRKEVSKSKKWYFYDNGIRNALINNFSSLHMRNDIGQLWEQYFMAERMKFNASKKKSLNYYFWRTYDHQEIDLLEYDSKGNLHAFECKWGKSKAKKPAAFAKAYPEASFDIITKENYWDWVV